MKIYFSQISLIVLSVFFAIPTNQSLASQKSNKALLLAQSPDSCSEHGPQNSNGSFQNAIPVRSPGGELPLYAGKTGINGNGENHWRKKIDTETRCIFFKDVNPSPAQTDKPRQTWVVIHGWDDDSQSDDMKKIAQQIAARNPGDRVLLLDWSEASRNAGDDGANPLGLNEKIGRGNYYAATWIAPVAEVVVKELKTKYGISGAEAEESLNLVGHSLGSILSAQIGKEFKNQGEGNQFGVSSIFALDPASEINVNGPLASVIGGLGGYDVDGRTPAYIYKGKPSVYGVTVSPFETRELVPEQRQAPERFDNAAKFSRAFVGIRSFAGNKDLASSADETFQVDFGSIADRGDEHKRIPKVFANLVDPSKNFFGDLLDINNNQPLADIEKNKYADGGEGIIGVNSDNTPDELGVTLKGRGAVTVAADGRVFQGEIARRGNVSEWNRGVVGLGRFIAGKLVEIPKTDKVFETPARREPTAFTRNSWSQVSILQNQLTAITQGGSSHIGSAAYYIGRSPNQDSVDTSNAIKVQQFSGASTQSLQEKSQFIDSNDFILKAPVDVVLNWDQSLAAGQLDLDSHLTGPTGLGDNSPIRFHTRFDDRGSLNSPPYALLYRDIIPAAGGSGPEQTRIQVLQDGVYRFYVHDYTNRDTVNSPALAASEATVQFFNNGLDLPDNPGENLGTNVGGTIEVPNDRLGNVWYVFQLDTRTGILKRVNVPFGNVSDRVNVPSVGER